MANVTVIGCIWAIETMGVEAAAADGTGRADHISDVHLTQTGDTGPGRSDVCPVELQLGIFKCGLVCSNRSFQLTNRRTLIRHLLR